MPETTTPQLTESDIERIEAREIVYEGWGRRVKLRPEERDALIRDWRSMKTRIEALTTEWCECGHSRDKHQFFSDHDECYECDQASPDLCCEWRPAPRPNENAALREQLAQAHDDNERLARVVQDIEEREAAVCPEDVGFDEYIRTLERRLKTRPQAGYPWTGNEP